MESRLAMHDRGHEPVDEGRGYQVKEGRRRHQVGSRHQRSARVRREVGMLEPHPDRLAILPHHQPVRPLPDLIRPGPEDARRRTQQRWVVVEQNPVLIPAQQRRRRAQIGARAAADIDHAYRANTQERPPYGFGHGRATGTAINRLPQS